MRRFLWTGIPAGVASTPCFHLLQRFVADLLNRRTDPLDAAWGTVIRTLESGL
jgi:hypothetical protein